MPDNQPDLFAVTAPPTTVLRVLPLNALNWVEMPVTPGFITSVRRFGVIEPVIVMGNRLLGGVEGYSVVAGRRRCTAAREAGLTSVPAVIYPANTAGYYSGALALTENNQRSANPVTDYRAIQRMLVAGLNETQVAHALGLSIGVVRARLRLARLNTALQLRLDLGQITGSAARRLAPLTAPDQDGIEAFIGQWFRAHPGRARVDAADLDRAITALRRVEVQTTLTDVDVTRSIVTYDGEPTTGRGEVEDMSGGDDEPASWGRMLYYMAQASAVMPSAPDDEHERARILLDELIGIAAMLVRDEVPHA